MKLSNYIPILLLGFVFVQCKPKRDPNKIYFDTPAAYNDFIVKEQKEVMRSFDRFATAINNANVDSIIFYHDQLSKRAELAEASVNKMADYKGDTLFRAAASELFEYVNYACQHELKEIVDLTAKGDSITIDDIKLIADLSDTYTIKERDKNNALIAAQEKFAKKYNVNIR